jgi:hypothetical protein
MTVTNLFGYSFSAFCYPRLQAYHDRSSRCTGLLTKTLKQRVLETFVLTSVFFFLIPPLCRATGDQDPVECAARCLGSWKRPLLSTHESENKPEPKYVPDSKKVKCTHVQAVRLCTGRTAHGGRRGIALPFHDHGTRSGWGVSVTPRPLFTPGKSRYPLYRRLGGPQDRSG